MSTTSLFHSLTGAFRILHTGGEGDSGYRVLPGLRRRAAPRGSCPELFPEEKQWQN
jgi:hypothetical protein